MMNVKHIFTGGLNMDDANSVVPQGDYRNAANVRIVSDTNGRVAAIKNIKGNQKVNAPVSINSDSKVIGVCEDKEKTRVYYFIESGTSTQQYILCYRKSSNDIRVVLKSKDVTGDRLNLKPNTFVDCRVVGDFIYWTDNENNPRRINAERGIKTYHSGYVSPDGSTPEPYELDIDEEDITVIRRPPKLPLTVTKKISEDNADIPDQTTNFIENGAFQFASRYIYRDNSKSVFSPYSKISNYNGDTDYDTVRLSLSTDEEITNEVEKAQFLMRNGNTGSWSIIKEFSRSQNESDFNAHNAASATLQFDFFNDRVGLEVSDEESSKPFDNVPLKSQAIESAKNRIFLANNTLGYDPVENVTMSAETSVVSSGGSSEVGLYVKAQIVIEDSVKERHYFILVKIDLSSPQSGWYKTPYSRFKFDVDEWLNGTLPNPIGLDPDDKIMDIGEEVEASDAWAAKVLDAFEENWSEIRTVDTFYDYDYGGQLLVIQGLSVTGEVQDGFRHFKANSSYQLGIVFFDFAGRHAGVYTNDDLLIKMDDRGYVNPKFNQYITWSITGAGTQIPTWATHYAIVRTKNLTTSHFVQGYTTNPKYVTEDEDGVFTYGVTYDDSDTIAVAIDINHLHNDGLGYLFSEGDLIRIYSSDLTTKYTLEVIGQEGKYIHIKAVDLGDLTEMGGNDNLKLTYDLYTPYMGSVNETFYEVGEVFLVDNPGESSRDYSIKSGNISGDVYAKARVYEDATSINATAMNPNDNFWSEWLQDTGRAFIVLRDSGQETLPTNIVYSNTFVQGSKVNGLNSFDVLDSHDLDEQNGPIQKLMLTSRTQQYGNVMLAICENEAASIYLGQTQVLDDDGDSVLATSGRVIGTVNNLKGSWGTVNPESVAENEGQVYWFDKKNAKVVRYSSNGVYPVSEYKMSSFFLKMSDYVGNWVPGGFDKNNDEYLLGTPTKLGIDMPHLVDTESLVIEEDHGSGTHFIGYLYYGKVYKIETSSGDTYTATISFLENGESKVVTLNNSSGDYFYTPEGVRFGLHITIVSSGSVNIKVYEYEPNPHEHVWRQKMSAFSEDNQRWVNFYEYFPDLCASIDNLLVSWKNGEMYTHNSDTYNSFFGITSDSKLSFVVNNDPVSIKIAKRIAVQSSAEPDRVHIRTVLPFEQSTDIVAGEFSYREGVYYAPIKKDRLSPNVSGTVVDKMLKGDDLRSEFLNVSVEWNESTEFYAYFVDVGFNVSSGHKAILQ